MANIDDIRRAAARQQPQRMLTKPRIIAVLAVLVAVVLVWVVNREPFDLEKVPSSLIGLWTTDDQELSDRFVEFRPGTLRLGTGGTSDVRFNVLGLDAETIGGVRHLTLFYRDLAGTRHAMEMLLDEADEELRLMDHPGAVWTKLKR